MDHRAAYDTALLGILQNEGNIQPFLDTIFGFLYRKTDFYRILEGKDGKLGFPPGVAAKLAMQSFRKYEMQALADHERIKATHKDDTAEQPQAAAPVAKTAPKKAAVDVDIPDAVKNAGVKDPAKKTDNPDNKDDPVMSEAQKIFQSNPDSYNGAIRDNYSWSQTITDVDIKIDVPEFVKKGKDVKVEIGKQAITTMYSKDGEWTELLKGDLSWPINREESMWSLVPGSCIQVNLEKVQERWWEAALKDEPRLSVRKMDPSRPMSDLDEGAQAKIQEMMYNDHQKKLGLPTSQEAKMQQLLKDAWDKEGSPFKGQPFDPSLVDVTQNNM